MVVDQGLGSCELDFSAILDTGQLTNGLVDVAFVEDAETFPENEDRILTFF